MLWPFTKFVPPLCHDLWESRWILAATRFMAEKPILFNFATENKGYKNDAQQLVQERGRREVGRETHQHGESRTGEMVHWS